MTTTICTPRGILFLVFFIIGVALFLLLPSCAPASDPYRASLCAQVAAGGLLQDGQGTVSVIVDREVVATRVPFADVIECGGAE